MKGGGGVFHDPRFIFCLLFVHWQYTFKHRPVRLVYSEAFRSEDEALAQERQLKRWSRGKKVALIAGDLDRLKRLSKLHS